MKPLLSYITVVKNGADEIERTIQSILPFRSSKVEYKIIDGGSTDGTVDLINSYQNEIDGWISEPDAGIYDAMNKGLLMAKGEFVCFINNGDQLLNCPIVQLEDAIASDGSAISFAVQLTNGNVFFPSFSGRIKLENTLHHQGTYYRKNKIGYFDLSFKVFADFDVNQRLYKRKELVLINRTIITSLHKLNGISQDKKHFNELFRVVQKNFGPAFSILSFFYFRTKYGRMKKFKFLT